MRILFTKQFPLDAPGGETSHLFALAHQMRAMGVEVYMMPVTDHATQPGIWPTEYIREVHPFGFHRFFDSFSLSKAVADFVKETPVDAVLSWQYETAFLPNFSHSNNLIQGVVATAPFGLLKRKTLHNPLRALIFNFFHFWMLHAANIIFCPSNFSKEELVKFIKIDPKKLLSLILAQMAFFNRLPSQRQDQSATLFLPAHSNQLKGSLM